MQQLKSYVTKHLKKVDSPRFNKMLEYMEDGLTVEDKAKDFLESELKTRLAQGEVIDDFEMLKYGQDLFNQYQSANEANKKTNPSKLVKIF